MSSDNRRSSNLTVRVVTAAVGIPIILAVDYAGGWIFAGLVALAAAIGSLELFRMERVFGYRPCALAGVLATAVIAVMPFVAREHAQAGWIGVLSLLVAGIGAVYLIRPLYPGAFLNWVFTLLPVLYVGVMLGHLGLLREMRGGAWWVLVVLVITWAYDTGAYFAGSMVGRHPFMQHVSPKKTVEGVAGGLLLATTVGMMAVPAIGLTVWQAPLLGLVLGVTAQLGDLVESMIKRQTGVKDSGVLIPGHGGLLDRIDSLLLTGTAAYYAAALLGYAS